MTLDTPRIEALLYFSIPHKFSYNRIKPAAIKRLSVLEGASLSMQVKQVLTQHLFNSGDPYELMNAARAWFNQNVPGFEWYLEDEWNHKVEGQTWIEHHIRCLGTRNEFGPIGYDVYLNHQDGKGVWHLDEYQHSVLILNDLSDLMGYLAANQP